MNFGWLPLAPGTVKWMILDCISLWGDDIPLGESADRDGPRRRRQVLLLLGF